MRTLQVIEENLACVISDLAKREATRQIIESLAWEKDGGMTFNPTGKPKGAIVVALGVPSLAEEKSARDKLRAVFGLKCQFSRTLDIQQRTSQYAIAASASDFLAANRTSNTLSGATVQKTKAAEQFLDERKSQPIAVQLERSKSISPPSGGVFKALYRDPWVQIVGGGLLVAFLIWILGLNK